MSRLKLDRSTSWPAIIISTSSTRIKVKEYIFLDLNLFTATERRSNIGTISERCFKYHQYTYSLINMYRNSRFLFWVLLIWSGSVNLFMHISLYEVERGAYAASSILMAGAAYNNQANSYTQDLMSAREQATRVIKAQELAATQAANQLQNGVAQSARVVSESAQQIDKSFAVINQERGVMLDSKKKAEALAVQELQHQNKLAALTSATNSEQERLSDITRAKDNEVSRFMNAKSKYEAAVQNLAVNRQSEIAAKNQFEQSKKN